MVSALAYLEDLIAFPTISRDSNLDLIAYLQSKLAALGITSMQVPSEDGRKANLWATIGPEGRPGIALSGHTDVVPVEGQAWTSDPFRLSRRDGKLYGRGSADMKGFIACCLAMAHKAAKTKLKTPIHFAFSYDEEIGCVGVRRLLDMLKDLPLRPRLCIVGEPTLMQAVTAHKGKLGFRVTAHGLEAHSSLAPIGVNAIYMATDLIGEIRAIQKEIEEHGGRDGDYDVAYTTLHVGKIAGGEVMNIVPNRASFDFEIRYLPQDDAEAIVTRIRAAAEKVAAVIPEHLCGGALRIRRTAELSGARYAGRQRGGALRAFADRRQFHRQDHLRHRRRTVPEDARHSGGGLRSGHRSRLPTSRTNMSAKRRWRPAMRCWANLWKGFRLRNRPVRHSSAPRSDRRRVADRRPSAACSLPKVSSAHGPDFIVPIDTQVDQRKGLLVMDDERGRMHRPFLAARFKSRLQRAQQPLGQMLAGIGGKGIGHGSWQRRRLQKIAGCYTVALFGHAMGAKNILARP